MEEPKHDGLAIPGQVVLAHERPFTLGKITIEPAIRQVSAGGVSETVEPRVMQTLVALARANGRVVTRDELIQLCWDGRIVSDDAINRVIGRLRRLGTQSGDQFAIETIARVGYRLVESPSSGTALPTVARTQLSPGKLPRLTSRRAVLLGAGAITMVASGAAWFGFARTKERSSLADLYFEQGLQSRGQATLGAAEQTVGYFRQATQIDPSHAEAWGALAWGYRTLLEFGPRVDTQRITMLARSAARRALQIDRSNADAQAALLLLKPFYGNWAAVEKGCRRLLARHPNHDITRFNLSHVLTETGRWRESIPHLQTLSTRKPFWPLARLQLFRSLRAFGRLDEAEDQLAAADKLWPRRQDVWSTKVRHLLQVGRKPEALSFVNNEASWPVDSVALVQLDRLLVEGHLGPGSIHQRAVGRILEDTRAGAPVPWAIGDCALLGETEICYALIDGYLFGRGPWAAVRSARPQTAVLFQDVTAPLRRDPRFGPLLHESGFERFWAETGTKPDFRTSPLV